MEAYFTSMKQMNKLGSLAMQVVEGLRFYLEYRCFKIYYCFISDNLFILAVNRLPIKYILYRRNYDQDPHIVK